MGSNLMNDMSDDDFMGKMKGGGDSDEGDLMDEVSVGQIIKNAGNLSTDMTDMNFQYFMNEEKIKPDTELKMFRDIKKDLEMSESDKQPIKSTNPIHNKHDNDSLDDLIDKTNYSHTQNSNTNPTANPNFHNSYNESQTDSPQKSQPKKRFDSMEDEIHQKLEMLRKLGELTQCGVKLSQNYNMNSDYDAMRYEYELHRSIRDKKNGVKWLSNFMLNACWGIELANESYNPFDFKLKGWYEQMNGDIGDYYEVFGELHEKYFKTGAGVSPEVKLVGMIMFSAMKFHLVNSTFGSQQSLDSTLKNNPALAQKLRQQVNGQNPQSGMSRDIFDQAVNNEHEIARKKAQDIQMVKEKEAQMIRERQEKELRELQAQLQAQRSDMGSILTSNNQPSISPPTIPKSLQEKFRMQQERVNQEQLMELERQQQIIEHKNRLAKKHNRTSASKSMSEQSPMPSLTMSPKIADMISSNTEEASESKPKRGRKKKETLKIVV